ncbi:hypothetical protein VTO73DRAFT_11110 [Trametes versicolor]
MRRIAAKWPGDPFRPNIQLKTLFESLAEHPNLTPTAVSAARALKNGEFIKKYALSEKTLRPASGLVARGGRFSSTSGSAWCFEHGRLTQAIQLPGRLVRRTHAQRTHAVLDDTEDEPMLAAITPDAAPLDGWDPAASPCAPRHCFCPPRIFRLRILSVWEPALSRR